MGLDALMTADIKSQTINGADTRNPENPTSQSPVRSRLPAIYKYIYNISLRSTRIVERLQTAVYCVVILRGRKKLPDVYFITILIILYAYMCCSRV
jgi:hypothetical protein